VGGKWDIFSTGGAPPDNGMHPTRETPPMYLQRCGRLMAGVRPPLNRRSSAGQSSHTVLFGGLSPLAG
jgi:hypothetical protein